MSIHHHLDDATVLRYASGGLDPAFAVVVATHIAMCRSCRAAVAVAEGLGGHLLEHRQSAPVTEGLFERLMGRVESEAGEVDVGLAALPAAGDVPAPLARHIGPHLDAVTWRAVAPGIRKHAIDLGDRPQASLFMLAIAPGRKMPEHGHGGDEMTLILSGSYRDAFGRFARGDLADLDEHVEHQPKVDSEIPCICLVATDAPTRFKGRVSRVMQRFVGI